VQKQDLDHSYVEFTWQPDFTPDGAGAWRVVNDPVLAETGAGSSLGIGLNLEAPTRSTNSIVYRGKLRECLPIGAGYAGISYTGQFCSTKGTVEFGARINAQHKVEYLFPPKHGFLRLREVPPGSNNHLLWTTRTI
jgi:hypothetical protein